jgi:hypothetical protein
MRCESFFGRTPVRVAADGSRPTISPTMDVENLLPMN